jgi:hypothetical protein
MPGQKLNIFLGVLAGVAMTLSACQQSGEKLSSPVNNSETLATPGGMSASQEHFNRSKSAPQVTTPSASQSAAAISSQKPSQDKSKAKASATSAPANRENYKPISLAKLAKSNAVVGNDPKAIALAAFGDIDTEGGSRDVRVEYPQPNRAVVIVTLMGVADDSVRGIRYRAELVPTAKSTETDKQWEMVWAGSQYTCQQGRGHQDWSTELCS